MNVALIITTMLISGSADGGAHASTTVVPFETMALCQSAAVQIARDGNFSSNNFVSLGRHQVRAACVTTKGKK